ncbi:MAG: CPBP family glutamic-type intramembrane protease [Pseudomonadota bacterium]
MTTSPLTPRHIEETFGDIEPAAPPSTVREEWSRFWRFVKAPRLPIAGTAHEGATRATARMLGLDTVFMFGFIAALGLASTLGFTPPENINSTLTPDIKSIALIVLLAPLGEELLFRGPLSGRPRDVIALPILGVAVFMISAALLVPESAPVLLAFAGVMALVAAAIRALLRGRGPWPFFRRFFAPLFWLSALGFPLIHLGNYAEGSLAILLPLVLPQFALGTMLAYLRVHYGFATALALHAIHNALLFGLAVLGGLGSEAGAA